MCTLFLFFVKQKTAYEMRISDWASDVCSSDLIAHKIEVVAERQVASAGFRIIGDGEIAQHGAKLSRARGPVHARRGWRQGLHGRTRDTRRRGHMAVILADVLAVMGERSALDSHP